MNYFYFDKSKNQHAMRSLALLLFVFAFTPMSAQPFQITFTGSGQTTSVTTVEVQNLTQGTTLSLNGSDILELVESIGIQETLCGIEDRGLRIYPNPMADECLITFENPRPGAVSIEITNLAGQLVIREEASLQQGVQSFSAGGLQQGLYVVQVKTSGKQYTNRLISAGSGSNQPFVRLANNSSINFPHGKLSGIIKMQYNAGEKLLFKGISGSYARVITLLPTESQNLDFDFIACTDGDNNHYPVVTIGTQTWMAENLKTINYNNSTAIPLVTDNTAWVNLSTPAYCWYDNDYSTYGSVYGALYNWFTVETGNLCPTGWHVPTDSDWSVLIDYLGGESVAGWPLKEAGTVHWISPNTNATNSSGFTALPGGYRKDNTGDFNTIEFAGHWWSSTAYSSTSAWIRTTNNNNKYIYKFRVNKQFGFSVRCVWDSIVFAVSLPTISTDSISAITVISAVSGGNVSADGGAAVTARGVCWNTNPNPTTASSKTSDGTSTGIFTSNLTGLTSNTTYYVRAYATNSYGTAYGNELVFTTIFPVYDIDGNGYDTVQIGTQEWLKQNLKTTRYRNGTVIPNVTSNSSWLSLSTGARCWYNNDSVTCASTYGALYNWYAVSDTSGLCPTNWHVPSDPEWTILTDFLGGENLAGGPLKETGTTHWNSPNTGATNSSGFTALPAGMRNRGNGASVQMGINGYWWTSTPNTAAYGWYRKLYYNDDKIGTQNIHVCNGFSVRCVRD
jgi:uncharacterized protein (TIGR02145 family)